MHVDLDSHYRLYEVQCPSLPQAQQLFHMCWSRVVLLCLPSYGSITVNSLSASRYLYYLVFLSTSIVFQGITSISCGATPLTTSLFLLTVICRLVTYFPPRVRDFDFEVGCVSMV
jgi:hypothetical protein